MKYESTQSISTIPTYEKVVKIIKKYFNDAAILDYGAGLGLGADILRKYFSKVDTYEPFPNRWLSKISPTYSNVIPTKKYSVITCINVINILKRKDRHKLILNILNNTKKKSIIIFKARQYTGDLNLTKNYQLGTEPKSLYVIKNDKYIFHKGYDGLELFDEINKYSGKDLMVEKINNFVIIKKNI